MSEQLSIAILDDYQQVALNMADWGSLHGRAEITVLHEHISDAQTLVKVLQPFKIICIMRERTPFTRELFEQLPQLRLLITSGANNAAIDLAAAKEHAVMVCGTRSPGHAAAELAWGLLMALSRQLVREDNAMRNGQWQTTIGRDLKGQTLGIIGLGRHGSNIARFAQAFGMPVMAWSHNLTAQKCQELDVQYVDKQTLLAESDIISIHLKMGQRYRSLIDAQALALMKPSAYLVNTSRGPIIDQAALIQALQNGQIAGAGLDVYDQEPLPADHILRTLPNTVLTSHVGYVTEQTYRVFYGEMVEIISNWLDGKTLTPLA